MEIIGGYKCEWGLWCGNCLVMNILYKVNFVKIFVYCIYDRLFCCFRFFVIIFFLCELLNMVEIGIILYFMLNR